MNDNRMNLCTPVFIVSAEAYGVDSVKIEYQCVKDGFHVCACKWYKPLISVGGIVYKGECNHFHEGCTCRRARKEAKERAKRLLKRMVVNR